MKEVQDRFKDLQKQGIPADDPRMRAVQMEQLKMMKGAVPLGGCLPMLLQFPLLIAFYTAVTVSLAIRQASFMWLPDLSAGDPLSHSRICFCDLDDSFDEVYADDCRLSRPNSRCSKR